MLVTTVTDLFREPYSGYPWGFITVAGWGALGLMVVTAIVFSLVPWRRSVDDFTPEPVLEPTEVAR